MKILKQVTMLCLYLNIISINKSSAQWSNNSVLNTSICTAAQDQQDVRIVSDGQGGSIISWVDFRTDATTSDIYAQKIDSAGTTKWTSNGVEVSVIAGNDQSFVRMVEDGNGGIILAWQDWRNGDRDIYAQHINSAGNAVWTANGVPVVQKTFHQENPIIIGDGNNGAIVVWQDSAGIGWDIYAQKIDSNGTRQWNTNGVAVCTAAGDQINPKVTGDGSQGAIIVWQDDRNGLDNDIYAQNVDKAGNIKWAVNGTIICNESGTQNNPKIESINNGSAVIAWPDKRSGNYDVYAQLVDLSGIVQWTTNGVVISNAAYNQSAVDMTASSTGIFITWKDSRNNSLYTDIYAQYVNWSGSVQWAVNGISISTANNDQLNPNVILDNTGGVVIVWQDSVSNNWDIYAQRINASGTALWSTNGITVASAVDNQTSPKQIVDANGNTIVVWQDKRNGLDFNLYIQKITSGGALSIKPINTSEKLFNIKTYPNPFSTSTSIDISSLISNNKNLSLIVYDCLGNEVRRMENIIENKIILNVENLKPGFYMYKFKSEDYLYTGQLLIQ